MFQQNECPICMDDIEVTKNCVTTECGHCFHASCLMRSVATNGFGCPYCRTVMAEVPADDESTVYPSEVVEFEDDMLRGFRLFFNNINGDEHDEEDMIDEDEYLQELAENEEEEDPVLNIPIGHVYPPIDVVSQRLQEQGVTYEKLVHMFCNLEYVGYREEDIAHEFGDDLFAKVDRIVRDYVPPQPTVLETNIDDSAQPKSSLCVRSISTCWDNE